MFIKRPAEFTSKFLKKNHVVTAAGKEKNRVCKYKKKNPKNNIQEMIGTFVKTGLQLLLFSIRAQLE